MVESNEYHIYVHIDGAENKKSAVAGTGTGSTGNTQASGEDAAVGKLENAVKGMVSFAAIKSTADNLANFEISQVSLETGATEYEQRLNVTYNAVSQTVGAGAALIGAGIAGGPAGFAVAAIGLVVSGIQKIVGISQKA